jgi:hypothetical protein
MIYSEIVVIVIIIYIVYILAPQLLPSHQHRGRSSTKKSRQMYNVDDAEWPEDYYAISSDFSRRSRNRENPSYYDTSSSMLYYSGLPSSHQLNVDWSNLL